MRKPRTSPTRTIGSGSDWLSAPVESASRSWRGLFWLISAVGVVVSWTRRDSHVRGHEMGALWCVLCDEEFRSHGNSPPSCPRCLKVTKWRPSPCGSVVRHGWIMTPYDVRFLTINRIAPQWALVEDDGA